MTVSGGGQVGLLEERVLQDESKLGKKGGEDFLGRWTE